MHENYHDHLGHNLRKANDAIRKMDKVKEPCFECRLDPKDFIDWLPHIDDYFNLYYMSEGHQVRFAKIKVIGQAKLH